VEKVVRDPLFKKQLRLHELFGLEKAYNIHTAMTAQQILMWANSLLKPFCLQVRAGEKAYRLEPQLEVLDWIARKNKRGRTAATCCTNRSASRSWKEKKTCFLTTSRSLVHHRPPKQGFATKPGQRNRSTQHSLTWA
jgi:hypothetical protein